MERVGFYGRAGASLIDLFVFALVVHAAMLADVLLNRDYDVISFGAITWGAAGAMVVLGIALESMGSGTVGKRLLGLTIADEEGRPVPPLIRLRRAGMKFAPMVLVFFPVAAFSPAFSGNPYALREVQLEGLRLLAWVDLVVWAAVSAFVITGCFHVLKPARQAFHDQFAGTAVYHRQDLPGRRGFIPTLKRADAAMTAESDRPPEAVALTATRAGEEEPPYDGVL